MSRLQPIAGYAPGDFIADMHDQKAAVFAAYDVREFVTWESSAVFPFPNKELRMLGPASGLAFDGCIVAGFNYDNRMCGLLVLGDKVQS